MVFFNQLISATQNYAMQASLTGQNSVNSPTSAIAMLSLAVFGLGALVISQCCTSRKENSISADVSQLNLDDEEIPEVELEQEMPYIELEQEMPHMSDQVTDMEEAQAKKDARYDLAQSKQSKQDAEYGSQWEKQEKVWDSRSLTANKRTHARRERRKAAKQRIAEGNAIKLRSNHEQESSAPTTPRPPALETRNPTADREIQRAASKARRTAREVVAGKREAHISSWVDRPGYMNPPTFSDVVSGDYVIPGQKPMRFSGLNSKP